MTYDDIFEFWAVPEKWPLDLPSHVFLARAINEIGQTLFPDDWRPLFDVIEKKTEPLPEFIWRAQPHHHERAFDLIRKHRPDLELNQQSRRLTGIEWDLARSIISDLNKRESAGVERFDRVKLEIISGAQAGKLVTAVRLERGGPMMEAPSWWWSSEHISERFRRCQLNPNDLFGKGFAGRDFCLIFVTRESLAFFCQALRSAEPIKQTIALENQCQLWLEQQFLLPENKDTSKALFLKAATSKYGAVLGTKMFLRAWAAAVKKPGNEDRRRAGRKPG